MSRFRSMGLAAGAAASVLSCYMVSLRVARERGEVQRLEQQIADAHRDIRDLKTELGTRGRMRQLERWNSDTLALSAPAAAQYLSGSVALASYQPAPADAAPAVAVATTSDAPAQAVPAVEVKPTAPATPPTLVTASYHPPAQAASAAPEAKLVHTASLKADKPAKAKSGKAKSDKSKSNPVRIASAKTAKNAKSAAKAKSDKSKSSPLRMASAKTSTKASAKAKAAKSSAVRLASAKASTKSKSAKASPVRSASVKSAKARSGGPNAGLIHNASYSPHRKAGPTRVALLDDRVLGDISRAAAHEVKTGRKAVP